MNCNRWESRLIAYMDGKAGGAERREVEAHLATCEGCRTRARAFTALWGMLDELPAIQASEAFDAQLRARIAVEPAPRSFWGWIAPPPRLALSLSMLLLFSVWLASHPTAPVADATGPTEAEFKMINDLPVLENYDVLANFEVLSELPSKPAPVTR
jgi:anti-sigma factor RsiW